MSYAADITAVIGATGSGKGLYIRSILPGARRLIVWDWKGEYQSFGRVVRSWHDLRGQLQRAAGGDFRLIYVPRKTTRANIEGQFSMVCRAAFAVGRCMLVAEELSNVTRAGFSPPGWLTVITEGRERGLQVVGVSQRPALIDKSILDNATRIRCGRLNGRASRAFMADMMDVPLEKIAALADLQWLVWVAGQSGVTGETLTIPTRRRRSPAAIP